MRLGVKGCSSRMGDNQAILQQQDKQFFLCRIGSAGRDAVPKRGSSAEVQPSARSFPERFSKPSSDRSWGTLLSVEIVGGEFVVCLDAMVLAAFQRAGTSGQISVPRDLMVALRQYAFWQGGRQGYPLAGITFGTRYVDAPERCEQLQAEGGCDSPTGRPCQRIPLALRSVISLDGDILHQIRSDSLQNPRFPEIASAHHWVISQLMANFRISASQYIDSHPYIILIRKLITWVPVGCGTGFTLFRAIQLQSADFYALKQYLIGLLISALGPLSSRAFTKILLPTVANWALRQIISPDPRMRSFARRILGRFIP